MKYFVITLNVLTILWSLSILNFKYDAAHNIILEKERNIVEIETNFKHQKNIHTNLQHSFDQLKQEQINRKERYQSKLNSKMIFTISVMLLLIVNCLYIKQLKIKNRTNGCT